MRTKPNPVDTYVGERLQALRIARALSLGRFAGMLAVSPQELEKFENGSVRVGARHLLNASEILQVPVSYFFKGFNDKAEPDANVMTTQALLQLTLDDDSGK